MARSEAHIRLAAIPLALERDRSVCFPCLGSRLWPVSFLKSFFFLDVLFTRVNLFRAVDWDEVRRYLRPGRKRGKAQYHVVSALR